MIKISIVSRTSGTPPSVTLSEPQIIVKSGIDPDNKSNRVGK